MKHISVLLLLALISATSVAQNDAVTVYDKENFLGDSRNLYSHYNPEGLSDAFNNRIGSIRVPAGTWIVIFDETGFRGHYLVIENDWTATGDFAPWNNNISSILVMRDSESGLPVPQSNNYNTSDNYNNYYNNTNNTNNNNNTGYNNTGYNNTDYNNNNVQYNYNEPQVQNSYIPQNPGVFYNIEAAVKNPEDVIVLDIRGQNLSDWPAFFSNLKNMRELYISNNQFSSWPSFFSDLKQLRVIEAENNSFTSFPTYFSEFKNLEVLDLSGNPITSFPSFFHELTSLRVLDMSNTKVSSFPSFFNELTNLESLNISNTDISSFPSFFDELTRLRWMDISGTKITDLPYGVRSMNIVIVGRPD